MTRVWIHSRILLSASTHTRNSLSSLSHFLFLSLWAGGNRSAAYRNKSERKTRAYHAARPKNTLAANSSVRDEIARRKPHNIFGDGDARTRRSIKTLARFPCPRAFSMSRNGRPEAHIMQKLHGPRMPENRIICTLHLWPCDAIPGRTVPRRPLSNPCTELSILQYFTQCDGK